MLLLLLVSVVLAHRPAHIRPASEAELKSGALSCPKPPGDQLLSNGFPVCQTINSGYFSYYSFQVTGCVLLDITVTDISGDPDLFVSTNVTHPTFYNYTWSDARTGGANVALAYPANGLYYIGVYGYTDTAYTIVASCSPSSQSVIQLSNGIAQEGVNNRSGTFYYYTFSNFGVGDRQIRIDAIATYGDPDLYVKTDGSLPTTSYYDFASTNGGSDSLLINVSMTGKWTIGVYAYTGTEYTLYATTDSGIVLLLEQTPYYGQVLGSNYNYFQFPVLTNAYSPRDVQIVSTAYSGDPDLYVSHYTTNPSMSNYEFSATNYGSNMLTIPMSSLSDATYFISVYGFMPSDYSLTVSYTGHIILAQGIPQYGSLTPNGISRYYYYSYTNSSTVSFNLEFEAYQGEGAMYVGMYQDPNPQQPYTYQWSTNTSTYGLLSISTYCYSNCTFYIAVQAGYNQTNFIITATSANQTTQLARGQSQISDVNQNAPIFYKYDIFTTAIYLNLILTEYHPLGYSNNPIMYVSRGNITNKPSPTNYMWRSYADEPAIRITTPISDTYYIGVYGPNPNSSYFTMLGYDDQSGVVDGIQLIDGLPQDWYELNPSSIRYFVFSLAYSVPTLNFYFEQQGCGVGDQCSNRGSCSDGVCICNNGITGAYCDNQMNAPTMYISTGGAIPSPTSYKYKVSVNVGKPSITLYNQSSDLFIIGVISPIAPSWYRVIASGVNSPPSTSESTFTPFRRTQRIRLPASPGSKPDSSKPLLFPAYHKVGSVESPVFKSLNYGLNPKRQINPKVPTPKSTSPSSPYIAVD